MTEKRTLKISLALSMLKELGVNLYSNNPAVISEAIANAWDANAKNVEIDIDLEKQEIVISDDGDGMTRDNVIDRYLTVGYHKREDTGGKTERLNRKVMGRKGIGKLALFSIAKEIEVHTVKGGEKTAFVMHADEIEQEIKNDPNGTYKPREISEANVDRGTKIILREMKNKLKDGVDKNIRTRTARRFMVLFGSDDFKVTINGSPVTIDDRGYWNKMEMLWLIGDIAEEGHIVRHIVQKMREKISEDIFRDANKLDGDVKWENETGQADSAKISGWIGTAKTRSQMKDEQGESLNKLIIMVRGKLAHEDVLPVCNSAKIGVEYIIGEIYADFLDVDDENYRDIAISNRQGLIEDEPRVKATINLLKKHVETVSSTWISQRSNKGLDIAMSIPKIKEWYDNKTSDAQKVAKKLFGDAYKNKSDSPDDLSNSFRVSVMAVETMDTLGKVSELENLTIENIETLGLLFDKLDLIEAGLWHALVRSRIIVIEELNRQVKKDAYEKVIQEHIYDHLWLLDPSWERSANLGKYIEQTVMSRFEDLKRLETREQQNGRVDIGCRTAAGKDIIIELKRPSVKISAEELCTQMDKYYFALKECLRLSGQPDNNVECIAILGGPLSDMDESDQEKHVRAKNRLKDSKITVVYYEQLLNNANVRYKEFFDAMDKTTEIQQITQAIYDALLPQTD